MNKSTTFIKDASKSHNKSEIIDNNSSSGNNLTNDNYDGYHIYNSEYQLSKDEIVERILNEKNIYITEHFVNGIFKHVNFDHKVQNLANFQTAMVHSSYIESIVDNPKSIAKIIKDIEPIDTSLINKCIPLQKQSYERLEFLGDSILRHAIGKYLYNRYPTQDEGFLTTNRSKIENTNGLSKLSIRLGFHKYIIIDRHIEKSNGRITFPKIVEDVFEAFIGALNLEVSDDRTREFVWKLIEQELDLAETIRTQNNYKDILMQYFHKVDIRKHDLEYFDEQLDINGKKRYRTTVSDKDTGQQLGYGRGRSKKSSQQSAAKDALIKLKIIGNDNDEDEYFDYDGDFESDLNKVRNLSSAKNDKNLASNHDKSSQIKQNQNNKQNKQKFKNNRKY